MKMIQTIFQFFNSLCLCLIACTSLQFPNEGIKLSFIEDMIKDIGRKKLMGITTATFTKEFLQPQTKPQSISYTDLLMQGNNSSAVGQASAYVSHVWKSKFLETIDILSSHFKLQNSDPFLWFDIFTINQHSLSTASWTPEDISKGIKNINHTVIILNSWQSPLAFTRAWCVWELYSTVKSSSKLEILANSKQKKDFLNNVVLGGKGIEGIRELYGQIDSSHSVSSKSKDQKRIHQLIKQSIGFENLDEMMFQEMKKWFIKVTEEEVEKAIQEGDKLRVVLATHGMGRLLSEQEQYVDSLAWFQTSLLFRERYYGKESFFVASVLSNMGHVYLQIQNFQVAETKYNQSIAIFQNLLKDSTNSPKDIKDLYYMLLITMNQHAQVLSHLNRFSEALNSFSFCLTKTIELFGENDQGVLTAVISIAKIYLSQGDPITAPALLKEVIPRFEKSLGTKHENVKKAKKLLSEIQKKQKQAGNILLSPL